MVFAVDSPSAMAAREVDPVATSIGTTLHRWQCYTDEESARGPDPDAPFRGRGRFYADATAPQGFLDGRRSVSRQGNASCRRVPDQCDGSPINTNALKAQFQNPGKASRPVPKKPE